MPQLVPLLVGHFFEGALEGGADVVHEAVDAAELLLHLADETLGLAGATEVGRDVHRLADAGRLGTATARDDLRSLGRQKARRLEADATGRTGDEDDAPLQAEIHGWLA